MRTGFWLSAALLGLAPLAQGQRFGFAHHMIPADRDNTLAVALGDVDGDGDLDAFFGNSAIPPTSPGVNRLCLNDGTGVLADATAANLPSLIGDTQAVGLGDLDGDGDLDAFAGMSGQDRLYLNVGAGVFTDATATNMPALLAITQAVALGDVDGDGAPDAFLGTSGQDRLYLNLGAALFGDATATNLPIAPGDTRAVALGDVDGDGDLDALVGRSGVFPTFAQSRLYLNGGFGIFADATATNLPAPAGDTRAVGFGDFDGDGDLDAFLGNFSVPNRVLENGGAGAFTVSSTAGLPTFNAMTRSVALGDVEADGDLDLFLGTPGAFDLFLNGGTGTFASAGPTNLPPLDNDTFAVALGDLDGDGDLDAINGNAGQDRLYLNDGAASFADGITATVPAIFGASSALALADVDGDADLDALVAYYSNQNRLYLNDGTGVFSDGTPAGLPTQWNFTNEVAAGDVDGDGDPDLLLGNSGLTRLYLNGGSGSFTDATATNLPYGTGNAQVAGLGDLDGDGDLDALVGNYGGQDRLLFNGGSGIFAEAPSTTLPLVSIAFTSDVAFGDVDGDGDLDAYLGSVGGSSPTWPDRLLANGGNGFFTDVTGSSLPAPPGNTRSVELGDVDGDGDLDAYAGRGSPGMGEQDLLLLNDGVGNFADVTGTNLPFLLDATVATALGDVDGDGDPDAFVANGGQNRLLENAGGVFVDVTATELAELLEPTMAVALGDLDGDGDLDAFAGVSGQQNRLYVNLTRQISWRGIPRAGKSLALDLRGPASGTWLLGASATSASIPLPPFGTLRLGLSTLFIVGGGILDPQGRATVSFLVPPIPALVGVSHYWQAVVGPPVGFTNLERTTVTGL